MRWLFLTLAGPTLWAVMFSIVYALHGVVCAGVAGPEGLGLGARWMLIVVWVLGLAAFVPLYRALPHGGELTQYLPRLGVWIGLAATAFTLFPVVFVTSC
ncbi:hypothetical protein [Yoonia sp.]|uniref:hypothetical protein n=1 Tax=Yoonia sp. TaxID=2212373 RepID=UPI003A4E3ACA